MNIFRYANGRIYIKVLPLLLIMLLSGCAAVVGHGNSLEYYNKQLAKGDCDFSYIDKMIKNDPLLWNLNGGALARNCQQYALSNRYFDMAENLFKRQEEALLVLSVGQTLNSVLVNDNVNDYQGENHEKIMTNVYKGLNFLSLHDFANARVEFNRALDRQRRAKEYFAREIELARQNNLKAGYSHQQVTQLLDRSDYTEQLSEAVVYPDFVNPFATYISGLFFYLDGDRKKARDTLKDLQRMLPNNPSIADDLQLLDSTASQQDKYVWVIYENGNGMIKKSFSLEFPTYLLTDKLIASRLSLPTLYAREASYPYLLVDSQPTHEIANMDSIVQQEFKKRVPIILSSAITNTLVKSAAQYSLEKEYPQYGGGWLAYLYQWATDTADVRSWRALAKNFQVVRIKLTGNNNNLVIRSDKGKAITEVRTNGNAIVYIRSDIKNHVIVHLIEKNVTK